MQLYQKCLTTQDTIAQPTQVMKTVTLPYIRNNLETIDRPLQPYGIPVAKLKPSKTSYVNLKTK